MCKVLKVSRNSYYRWFETFAVKQNFNIILILFQDDLQIRK